MWLTHENSECITAESVDCSKPRPTDSTHPSALVANINCIGRIRVAATEESALYFQSALSTLPPRTITHVETIAAEGQSGRPQSQSARFDSPDSINTCLFFASLPATRRDSVFRLFTSLIPISVAFSVDRLSRPATVIQHSIATSAFPPAIVNPQRLPSVSFFPVLVTSRWPQDGEPARHQLHLAPHRW